MPRCVSVMKTYSEISLRKRRGHESVSIGTKNLLDRFAHWIPIWLLVLDCSPCSNKSRHLVGIHGQRSRLREKGRDLLAALIADTISRTGLHAFSMELIAIQPPYKNFLVAKSRQKKRVSSDKSYKLFGDAEREQVDQRRFT